ncbi:MAG: amidohydrolase family protein [Bryobacterales bacterium]|nr:amidohydrolase family protein [Bryobacterales bacterium]MDE0263329.1 amidohydrolase family protein [Bryobacterales bacterium]MDE0623025.1 amidohydrolase family protein [Bryobacterales bacterium]
MTRRQRLAALVVGITSSGSAFGQIAVTGATVHTAAGEPLTNAVVVIEDGKISQVGLAGEIEIPDGFRTMTAAVVTPGLIDARSTIGLSGYLNQEHDQDQIESSAPMQPELRAIDAYNPREALVEWVRGYGVTTVHTGHAPLSLVSGQTAVMKTHGLSVEEAVVKPFAMIAATVGEGARERGDKAPGTRAKMAAMLRAELIKTREYLDRRSAEDEDKRPDRDLRLEALGEVMEGNVPLLVTAQRTQDILTVLRIREEFDIPVVLDGVAEAYDVLDQIRDAGVSVIVHPTMMRARGETENLSFETAARLRDAGIPIALQGGYESYVPKSRLVLFEAGVAAAHGLGFDDALRSVTINAARVLGVDDRIGSIEVGKDGDIALYDGDPFEYSTHCVAVIIDGEVVSEELR